MRISPGPTGSHLGRAGPQDRTGSQWAARLRLASAGSPAKSAYEASAGDDAFLSVPRADLCPRSPPAWHCGPGFRPETHAFDHRSASVWEDETPQSRKMWRLHRHGTHATRLAT